MNNITNNSITIKSHGSSSTSSTSSINLEIGHNYCPTKCSSRGQP
jgi:hypothetical protein